MRCQGCRAEWSRQKYQFTRYSSSTSSFGPKPRHIRLKYSRDKNEGTYRSGKEGEESAM